MNLLARRLNCVVGYVQLHDIACKHFCSNFSAAAEVNASALRNRKHRAQGHKVQAFADWRRTRTIAGNGGNGLDSFLHLWCNADAGPSGGDGGNGGHVIFQASASVKCLNDVASVYQAEHGDKGKGKDGTGKSGEHLFVKVPCGTIVKSESGGTVTDLLKEGDMFLAARGGAGGKGNHYFLSNENKSPQISEIGAQGEDRAYILEMRTIAHVGLIGYPNAGKSTLLRAISRARPKIASYPFTTLRPHVGIVNYDDYEQIAVADIPGLIPDAHLNRGLGISFLKHVERCLCFLYVIDLSQPEPWSQLETLRSELEHYKPGLSERTYAIVGNKIDLLEAQQNLAILREKVDIPIIPLSAKHGVNVSNLLKHLRYLYDQNKLKETLNIS